MKTIEPSNKERKQISFNISEEDHEIIKRAAMDQKIPMRVWIINAMAEKIKRDAEQNKQEVETYIKELWPS